MLKKCLIALALVAFCSAPVMADPTWAATTTFIWEWAEKECCRIPVKMYVVMWADVYCPDELVVIQQDNGDFYGCVELKLCVNFEGIDITAEYLESVDVGDKYIISLTSANDSDTSGAKNKPSATIRENARHLSGAEMPIDLCLRILDVDPQAMAYTGNDTLHTIGTVVITVQPVGQAQSGGIPPYVPGA